MAQSRPNTTETRTLRAHAVNSYVPGIYDIILVQCKGCEQSAHRGGYLPFQHCLRGLFPIENEIFMCMTLNPEWLVHMPYHSYQLIALHCIALHCMTYGDSIP